MTYAPPASHPFPGPIVKRTKEFRVSEMDDRDEIHGVMDLWRTRTRDAFWSDLFSEWKGRDVWIHVTGGLRACIDNPDLHRAEWRAQIWLAKKEPTDADPR